jgi:hypothetical protein
MTGARGGPAAILAQVDRMSGDSMFPNPPEHPLHGRNFGVIGTVTALIDLWADTRQLPSYMRQGRRGPA